MYHDDWEKLAGTFSQAFETCNNIGSELHASLAILSTCLLAQAFHLRVGPCMNTWLRWAFTFFTTMDWEGLLETWFINWTVHMAMDCAPVSRLTASEGVDTKETATKLNLLRTRDSCITMLRETERPRVGDNVGWSRNSQLLNVSKESCIIRESNDCLRPGLVNYMGHHQEWWGTKQNSCCNQAILQPFLVVNLGSGWDWSRKPLPAPRTNRRGGGGGEEIGDATRQIFEPSPCDV